MIIDCAIYRDGLREDSPTDVGALESALASLSGKDEFLWIGLFEPTADELEQIAVPLKLHPLAVEDAVNAHQRPKVERYEDHIFMSIKTVTYDNDDIETAEINAFLGANYLLTVHHGKGHDLREVRHRAETQHHELEHGPTATLYSVVDSVVDDYEDVADHLLRVAESIDSTDHLLDNALNAHLAQLSIQQNVDMRKLAAGAALFAAPTMIAGVYGINFDHMPEFHWL